MKYNKLIFALIYGIAIVLLLSVGFFYLTFNTHSSELPAVEFQPNELNCVKRPYRHRARVNTLILCKNDGVYTYWDDGTPGDSVREAWMREMALDLD